MTPDSTAPPRSGAGVLRWQAQIRVAVAVTIGVCVFALRFTGLTDTNTIPVAVAVFGYIATVVAVAVHSDFPRGTEAAPWRGFATLLADVAFIMALTAATAAPTHYGRTLIAALFVLHVAETLFGTRHARAVWIASVAGFLVLVRMTPAGDRDWGESLWSIALFGMTGAMMIASGSARQRRLLTIVSLFEEAEAGDFAQAYDVNADRVPDTVTRVGQAYNRVRVQFANMVHTDSLTGCLNRRGFDQAIAREVSRAARSGGDLSLLAVDLDHFKEINDSYGHMAGDTVLREFGAAIACTSGPERSPANEIAGERRHYYRTYYHSS